MSLRTWTILSAGLMGSAMVSAAPTSTVMDLPPGATECPSGPSAGGNVGCYVPAQVPNAEVWTIEKPRVDIPEDSYPAIRPRAGDLVSVFAGGCAQTGGHGWTWKRYVVPLKASGQDPSGLYYGSISIPGVISGQRLRDALAHGAFEVPSDPGSDAFVRLQYADDNLSDNGYWGSDPGTWFQCVGVPPAFVVVVLQHGCVNTPSPAGPCVRGMAMDFTSTALDANGVPLNPTWTWNLLTATPAPVAHLCSFSSKPDGMNRDSFATCASHEPQIVDYGGCWNIHDVGDILGHANFGAVTYTVDAFANQASGTPAPGIEFDNHDGDDDDWTWNLRRNDGALYTSLSPAQIQMEFDSDETVDHFTIDGWQSFHGGVNSDDEASGHYLDANSRLQNVSAIVVGMAGVDCPHGCLPEIHPVYGLALHMADSTPANDHWLFFARNWGDEGYCGRGDVRWPVTALSFTLPMPGASGASFVGTPDVEQSHNSGDIQLNVLKHVGAQLTIPLPDSSQHGFVDGEIRVKWARSLPPGATTVFRRPFPIWAATTFAGAAVSPAGAASGTEESLQEQLRALSSAQRKAILEHLRHLSPNVKTTRAHVVVVSSFAPTELRAAAVHEVVPPEPNPEQDRRIRLRESLVTMKPVGGVAASDH